MNDKVKLPSLDSDLKPISKKELAITTMEVCAVYNECLHNTPTETETDAAWLSMWQRRL